MGWLSDLTHSISDEFTNLGQTVSNNPLALLNPDLASYGAQAQAAATNPDLQDAASFLANPTVAMLDAQGAYVTGNDPLTQGGAVAQDQVITPVLGDSLGASLGTDAKSMTMTQAPWSGIQDQLLQGVDTAGGVYYNPDGTLKTATQVAPVNTTAALNAGLAPDAGRTAAGSFYGASLAGANANPYTQQIANIGDQQNQYLGAAFDQGAGEIRSKLDSQFAAAGRYGGSDHQIAMGGALGDFANNLYGGQYNADMNRRLAGLEGASGNFNQDRNFQAGAAGELANFNYDTASRQLGFGQALDAVNQQGANWDYQQQMKALNDYLATINAAGGNYGSQTQPVYSNGLAGIGAMLGGVGGLVGALAG